MNNEKIIVRWSNKGKQYDNIFEKKEIKKKIDELKRDYPHGYQQDIDDIKNIISDASSIYFSLDEINTRDTIPVLKYWTDDGDSSEKILKINMDEYIKTFIVAIFDIKNEIY